MESKIKNDIFDRFLELSDVSSVFKVLSRIEYILLRKLIRKADNGDGSGKVFLEEIKKDLNIPMPKVSEMVQAMNDEGLLLWKLDSVTKKTYIEITDKGREKCTLQREGMKKISERIDNELDSNEKDAIFNCLGKLGRIINEERGETDAYFELITGRQLDSMNVISLLKPKNSVFYFKSDYTISKAITYLQDSKYTTLPVVDDKGMYIGTVSDGDILHFISKNGIDTLNEVHVRDIVNTKRKPAVHDFDDGNTIINDIIDQNFLCMVDDRGCFIGIITRKDIIRYMKKKIEHRISG